MPNGKKNERQKREEIREREEEQCMSYNQMSEMDMEQIQQIQYFIENRHSSSCRQHKLIR